MSKNTQLGNLVNGIYVDSTGKVGVGTTSPDYALTISGNTDPSSGIRIKNTDGVSSAPRLVIEQNNGQKMQMYAYGNSFAFNYTVSNGIDFYDGTNSKSRLTINGSGNVGIGTSSPTSYASTTLQVNGSSSSASIKLTNTTTGAGNANGLDILQSTTDTYIYNRTTGIMVFGTSDTERMRINSNGDVLIGTTALNSLGRFNSYTNGAAPAGRFVGGPSNPDGNIVLMVDKYSGTTSTAQWFMGFTISNQGAASGVITANGASQAAFGSWSDRRLKENIVDLPSQLSNILALRPVEFDYIESEGGGHQISFIAQEFAEIYPDAVGERQDGMKTLTGWGKTEAILVKSIQELSAQVQELKAEIEILKQK